VSSEADSNEIENIAKEKFAKWIKDKSINKVIMPANKNVINFVLDK
jgi:hypothetical protein